MADPTALYDLAAAALAAVEAEYATAGVDLPARRYVAEGPPAYDCEQVVLAFVRLYPGTAFAEDAPGLAQRAMFPRSATLALHIVRCIPVLSDRGKPPTVPQLDGSAASIMTDVLLAPVSLVRAWHAGAWAGLCETFGIREVIPAEPSGGFGGSITTFDVQV